MNTVMQLTQATGNSPAPIMEMVILMSKAAKPANGDCVV